MTRLTSKGIYYYYLNNVSDQMLFDSLKRKIDEIIIDKKFNFILCAQKLTREETKLFLIYWTPGINYTNEEIENVRNRLNEGDTECIYDMSTNKNT